MSDAEVDKDPEHERRLAWVNKVRGLHRNKRMIGFREYRQMQRLQTQRAV